MTERVWVGIDPGGKGNFGVAMLSNSGGTETFRVDCADEAIARVLGAGSVAPCAIGIDAPLWWSSGRSSDRLADQWLRNKYGLPGGKVQTANSLRGAALVQGVMFAHRMREKFPNIKITESHPKAVLQAIYKIDGVVPPVSIGAPKAVWPAFYMTAWSYFTRRFGLTTIIVGDQEHERDAIIAAVCAREGFQGHWPNDLSLKRHPSEQDPSTYWLSPIHYFWPE